jgi:hypothetical protein
VLSEVLSNPPWVLSATPHVLSVCAAVTFARPLVDQDPTSARELDGEQGLRAGMQIEGFTCPAGPDGSRLRMLEAVNLS